MSGARATLLFVSVAGCVSAAPLGAQTNLVSPDSTPPRVVRLAAPVEVPMLNLGSTEAPRPGVEVMVNGRGPFRFGIETGARFLVVTPETAQRLGLGSVAPGTAMQFRVDSLTIGAALLGDLHVSVLPRSPRGVDGLLGLPAFQNLLLTIDYPRARVRLERGSLPRPDGATVLPLTRVSAFWGFPVNFAGHEMLTILDTRSDGAFSLDPKVESILPWSSGPTVAGRAGGAGIPTTEIRAGTLAGEVTFGRYGITSPVLTLHQLPPDYPSAPRIGARVLGNFAMTLDQANARLMLLRDGPSRFGLGATGATTSERRAAADSARGDEGSLAEYVGQYGDRTISLRGKALIIQRPGGRELARGRRARSLRNSGHP